jgi:hypothetical protein
MSHFVVLTLLALLAVLHSPNCVAATPAAEPVHQLQSRQTAAPVGSQGKAPPAGAVLSPLAQSLVRETVAWQNGTGRKWDLLAAKALLSLVKDVEANGWPGESCRLDDVYVRKEW